jgi:UDP-N-acetylmuramate dehydrogenase
MNFPFPVKEQEPLSHHCYMKVGGPADFFTITTTSDELVQAAIFARNNAIPFYILGGGSNTIFSDLGFRGLIIQNHTSKLEVVNNVITADSGIPTNVVVNKANKVGLSGLQEFLGIPGSIGGAIYNNSHYLKSLIGDSVSRVEVLNSHNTRQWLVSKNLGFSYDYSIFQTTKEVILKVEFILTPQDPTELNNISLTCLMRRRDTQPLELPSSGCMFKNPPGQSAGALIDSCGLKGYSIGGAEVSTVHASFIVNKGNATTKNIVDLSNYIIETVNRKYAITLQPEVFIVNEFGERINQ